MYISEIIEYTNRNKMEETTAKVFARLHHMKNILCKTFKKTPQFCGGISNHNDTYYSMTNDDIDKLSEPTFETLTNIKSDDTISSISTDSLDSGVSTLSDFSHCSLLSSSSLSTSLLNRTSSIIPQLFHLRCDPSIINYISHNLLSSHRLEYFLDEINDDNIDESPSTQIPLAESSRRIIHDSEQTIIADDEDEQIGPLTSTLIDRWYTITKTYSAIFRDDLTVRKNELVQVLRCSHPHWAWIRNEKSQEGFIPTDCLIVLN
ncbi:unnamed protein product [Rotaria sordida]|uniref:SH3 domain-containing protein n=1 Tax=Rotaria sordida TaxID=392033 RepID=A0A814VMK3_9BILA|nr:unnamed protein product [Rotaria sordida]CAF1199342.1 unnamed protein product [Rotaria sordida]CAF1414268.1 unnamed protein product [Rotaria sordida]CAF3793343.1 unnamed protein product [Rotaria sordida]CAF3868355.1 unnamed protein product [Rotaria sordida]